MEWIDLWMIFENYSQSNVFVTGENLVRRMRWLRRKKKKKGRNILWGKKAINFFWKSIFFFPPSPPPPQIHNEEKEKWSMQVWFAGILYSILASLLSCYIKSSPLLLRFVPFIRLFSYSTRYTLCLLVDSQRIRISSSQFNPLS